MSPDSSHGTRRIRLGPDDARAARSHHFADVEQQRLTTTTSTSELVASAGIDADHMAGTARRLLERPTGTSA